jgi:N-carbamoyl-L-amino-acid hydrolase
VGKIDVSPNVANAVAARAELVLEIRSTSEQRADRFCDALIDDLAPEFGRLRLRLEQQTLSRVPAAPCSARVQAAIKASAHELGLATRDLPSGAGHDGVFVARTGPIGMIFVPSRGGRSHVPEEWTESEHAVAGARVLSASVLRLDAEL